MPTRRIDGRTWASTCSGVGEASALDASPMTDMKFMATMAATVAPRRRQVRDVNSLLLSTTVTFGVHAIGSGLATLVPSRLGGGGTARAQGAAWLNASAAPASPASMTVIRRM